MTHLAQLLDLQAALADDASRLALMHQHAHVDLVAAMTGTVLKSCLRSIVETRPEAGVRLGRGRDGVPAEFPGGEAHSGLDGHTGARDRQGECSRSEAGTFHPASERFSSITANLFARVIAGFALQSRDIHSPAIRRMCRVVRDLTIEGSVKRKERDLGEGGE